MENVEDAFNTFNFQKVYVVGKTITSPQAVPLELLFVLNENGKDKQQEFIDLLRLDERIIYARNCGDLPFETVDSRYLYAPSDTFAVGETLEIEIKGYLNAYYKPFEFGGLYVALSNCNDDKAYTSADFPQVKTTCVEKCDNVMLYLKLAKAGYFNVIKAAGALSKLSTTKLVDFDYGDIISPPPPIWELSDRAVADFVDKSDMYCHSMPLTIIGLKPGTVTVSLNGVGREFTVL